MSYLSLNSVIQQIPKQVLIALFILIFNCNPAQATKASLQDIVLDSKNENLTLSFKLENAFPAEMKEVILNGTPITFTFFVVFQQVVYLYIDYLPVDPKILDLP